MVIKDSLQFALRKVSVAAKKTLSLFVTHTQKINSQLARLNNDLIYQSPTGFGWNYVTKFFILPKIVPSDKL